LSAKGGNAIDDPEAREFGSVWKVGDLNVGRYNHTSTLLHDGRVLVTGGTQDGSNSLASAELFDPEIEGWVGAANMSDERMRHTATVLGSRKVLVAGGYTGTGYGHPSLLKHFNGTGNISLDSCEIFDSVNVSFSPAPHLFTGRFWHRSVRLEDGGVLVMGGLNVSQGALSSCELFDPGTGTWSEAAAMGTARVRFTATLLSNGSVLVTGGHAGINKEPFASCELYVPEKDIWYEVSPMNKPRGYHAGILLQNGRVMVNGGFAGMGVPDWRDSEVYDPVNDSWELTGNMSLPRHNHVMVHAGAGEVLVVGGSNCFTGGGHSGIEYFDPVAGAWDHTNHVITGLKWTTAVEMGDDTNLICGGKECDTASNVSYVFVSSEEKENEDGDLGWLAIVLIPFIVMLFLALWFLLAKGGEWQRVVEASSQGEGHVVQRKQGDISHIAVIILGAVVIIQCSVLLTFLYLIMCLFGVIWFMGTICPHCRGFASPACPSGYGMISSRYFRKPEKIDFRKAFNRNIMSVALQWFVPLVAGIVCLYDSFDPFLTVVLVIFIVIAFIWLPMESKKKGCAKCPQRGECGWASGK